MRCVKNLPVILVSFLIVVAPLGADDVKGSGGWEKPEPKMKGSMEALRESPKEMVEQKSVAVRGVVTFSDFTGANGEKCAATFKKNEGQTFSLLANEVILKLKSDLMGQSGSVKIMGQMKIQKGAHYISVEEYKIIKDGMKGAHSKMEKKGSMYKEKKGSHYKGSH